MKLDSSKPKKSQMISKVKRPRSASKVKANVEQAKVEKAFPSIAKWVKGYGHVEIGDHETFGFVRAMDYGGQVFEDHKPGTLAEAMEALEQGLARWFKGEGFE